MAIPLARHQLNRDALGSEDTVAQEASGRQGVAPPVNRICMQHASCTLAKKEGGNLSDRIITTALLGRSLLFKKNRGI